MNEETNQEEQPQQDDIDVRVREIVAKTTEEAIAPLRAALAQREMRDRGERVASQVYGFIRALGDGATEQYDNNPAFRDMVDTKIEAIVSANKGVPLPGSEDVGGSGGQELTAEMRAQRAAYERSGLGEHMDFEEFMKGMTL
ncbi:MAG TPA: hypothetical protein VNI20_09730 [Fimbriimonadaceae bacterium]|nr:hypothetical protein [Fimbriimonadaceae bacterium]